MQSFSRAVAKVRLVVPALGVLSSFGQPCSPRRFAGEIGEIKTELNSSNQATIKDAVKKVRKHAQAAEDCCIRYIEYPHR